MNAAPSLDHVFNALGHPVRRALLQKIAGGEQGVVALASDFSCSLNAVSKHLRVLEGSGLLRRTRHGRSYRFSCEKKPVEQAMAWLTNYQEFWQGALNRLEARLEERLRNKDHARLRDEGKR